VSDVETDDRAHTAKVTFDDEKTSVAEMSENLADGNFPVEGEPTYLN
jgi:hypothetical protein